MTQKRTPQFIPGFGKSYALLSQGHGVNAAVIFVHGFGGKPTSTWRDFHNLGDEYSAEYTWWVTSDMFFYSYDSLHTPIRRNAELFGSFVDSVWHEKWREHSSRKYRDLILAGHSEGAVIIRRLILDRYDDLKAKTQTANPTAEAAALKTAVAEALASDFVLASYLRLFAPACRGTNFSSWVGFLTSLSHFVSAVTSTSRVRNELLPDSPVLASLKTGTEKAHAKFGDVRSLYTQPLFGDRDQIVISDSYDGERLLWDEGCDHFSVCKPSYSHKRPLEFVCK